MNTEPSMTAGEDCELMRRFAGEASAPAFSELVRRHLNHVYSSALRRVDGDHALAEDVTQTVFVDFARQARRIPPDFPPGGWLHRHTGFVASKMIHRERRRRIREQKSVAMNTPPLSSAADPEWQAAAPLLDAAMDTLPAADRSAIVLRFFEQKDFRAVGTALGLSDDSAQKKVSRALEKLRAALNRRGIASTGGALASLMAVHAVGAAPSALAGRISAQSLAAAAATGRTLGEALSGMNTTARFKAAAAAIVLVAGAGIAGPLIMRAYEHSRSTNAGAGTTPNAALAANSSPGGPAPATAATPVAVTMDTDALVAAAAAEWRGGRENVAATSKALGYLSRITPSQMRQALARAGKVADEPARALLTKYLLSLWAESEPEEAMAWASSDVAGPHQADLYQGILNAWAGRDPDAVIAWKGKTGAGQIRPASESVIATVFRTMARTNPGEALRRLEWLASPNERGQALRGILETVQTPADRERISAFVDGLREDDIRVQARRAVVEQWAQRDAPAAAAFVEKAEPAWERARLMDSLGLTWLQSDPVRAAEWWVTHAPGPDTLVKIINVWAQQDPNAAGKWLTAQPQGPASDAARMTFARQVADLDPESALRWAETVSDAPMREGTIDHVFANWKARDTAAADTFLNKSGWPAERLGRLQAR